MSVCLTSSLVLPSHAGCFADDDMETSLRLAAGISDAEEDVMGLSKKEVGEPDWGPLRLTWPLLA